MIRTCTDCGAQYEDEYRWTICPHGTFAANDGNNNFSHHPESYLSRKETMMDSAFEVHMLNDEGKKKAAEIALLFDTCLTSLQTIVPAGREFALVRTNMEQACFFAKKGMANQKVNQA